MSASPWISRFAFYLMFAIACSVVDANESNVHAMDRLVSAVNGADNINFYFTRLSKTSKKPELSSGPVRIPVQESLDALKIDENRNISMPTEKRQLLGSLGIVVCKKDDQVIGSFSIGLPSATLTRVILEGSPQVGVDFAFSKSDKRVCCVPRFALVVLDEMRVQLPDEYKRLNDNLEFLTDSNLKDLILASPPQ